MAISRAGLWEELQTTWLTLHCELMPWSMKAMDLIQTQYAAVGAAANASLSASIDVLTRAQARGLPVDFVAKGRKGYVQPALKCRGPEHLRIIYGPEYSREENVERLRSRGLSAKRQFGGWEMRAGRAISALDCYSRLTDAFWARSRSK